LYRSALYSAAVPVFAIKGFTLSEKTKQPNVSRPAFVVAKLGAGRERDVKRTGVF